MLRVLCLISLAVVVNSQRQFVISGDDDSHSVPTPYHYHYSAPADGASHIKSETSDGHGRVEGSYEINEADGRSRLVQYVADEGGFRASVSTNEPGTANQSPADVDFRSSAEDAVLPVPEPDRIAVIAREPRPIPITLVRVPEPGFTPINAVRVQEPNFRPINVVRVPEPNFRPINVVRVSEPNFRPINVVRVSEPNFRPINVVRVPEPEFRPINVVRVPEPDFRPIDEPRIRPTTLIVPGRHHHHHHLSPRPPPPPPPPPAVSPPALRPQGGVIQLLLLRPVEPQRLDLGGYGTQNIQLRSIDDILPSGEGPRVLTLLKR